MAFSPKAMRERFHELGAQRDAILAKSTPLREQRDKLENKTARKVDDANKKIGAIEKDLFEIDQERALISRALGHQTGEAE